MKKAQHILFLIVIVFLLKPSALFSSSENLKTLSNQEVLEIKSTLCSKIVWIYFKKMKEEHQKCLQNSFLNVEKVNYEETDEGVNVATFVKSKIHFARSSFQAFLKRSLELDTEANTKDLFTTSAWKVKMNTIHLSKYHQLLPVYASTRAFGYTGEDHELNPIDEKDYEALPKNILKTIPKMTFGSKSYSSSVSVSQIINKDKEAIGYFVSVSIYYNSKLTDSYKRAIFTLEGKLVYKIINGSYDTGA